MHLLVHVVPGQPTVFVTAITATSISLSWSVPSGSVVTSSEVMWRVFSTTKADDDEGRVTSGSITSTSYTIQELESGTNYSITVTVANAAGSAVSHPILINPRRACAARVTVVGLCVRLSVCLSVCLFVDDYSRTTGYEVAYERYQQLQCYKGMKKYVAILLKRLRSRDMA